MVKAAVAMAVLWAVARSRMVVNIWGTALEALGRFVRHFLQPIVALLRVFSSGLMGTDDAASRSYPRASRARRLVAIDGRFAVSGAPSMGDGPGQTW